MEIRVGNDIINARDTILYRRTRLTNPKNIEVVYFKHDGITMVSIGKLRITNDVKDRSVYETNDNSKFRYYDNGYWVTKIK